MTSMRTCICACVRAYLWPPTSSCAALGESLSLSGLCVFPDDMEGTGPGSGPGAARSVRGHGGRWIPSTAGLQRPEVRLLCPWFGL